MLHMPRQCSLTQLLHTGAAAESCVHAVAHQIASYHEMAHRPDVISRAGTHDAVS